jgi:hypothetical protein
MEQEKNENSILDKAKSFSEFINKNRGLVFIPYFI